MAAKMKKVGLFISNLNGGGAQRVVSTLSFGLSNYYQVHLLVHDGKQIGYSYRGELFDLKTPASRGWLKKFPNFLKRIRKIKWFKKYHEPAVVISFLENANILNLLSGRDAKTIISVRNYKSKQLDGLAGKIFSFLIKRLYNKCDCLVAPSQGIRMDLSTNFGVKDSLIKVIYNPYDLKYISEKAKADLPDSFSEFFKGSPVIITAGSLEQQKGHWHLIRAFRVVKEEYPEARLIIFGEGKLRPFLEELVYKLGLEESISMPGFEENPFRFLSKADLFVLPSLYEGFPNVLVEAMVCGLPVVAADCRSGPREILAPESNYDYQAEGIEQAEYGILVPVGEGKPKNAVEKLSTEELYMGQAVNNLWADKELIAHYQKKSLERVEHFKLETIVKQWVEIIES